MIFNLFIAGLAITGVFVLYEFDCITTPYYTVYYIIIYSLNAQILRDVSNHSIHHQSGCETRVSAAFHSLHVL